ncbi:MAG: DUF4830 domain-containing protein [Ruminococcus sp.]|nr:DUF4830 domain-containing protein [Ruminococcus sp.]
MFVYNVKVPMSKRTGIAISVISIVVSLICVVATVSINNNHMPDTATCDQVGAYTLVAENPTDERSFLSQFGLNAVSKSRVCEDITIPSEFNEIYNKYNTLQNKVGLDLSRYSGKTVKRVTYKLADSKLNYAVILVYKNRIIAGHLTNGEYGDKLLPLG